VIFTANATAGIKLVGDAFPWTRRSDSTTSRSSIRRSKLTILREAHTSLVGLRGVAHDENGPCIDVQTIHEHQVQQLLSSKPNLVPTTKIPNRSNEARSHHPSPPPSPSGSTSNLMETFGDSISDSETSDLIPSHCSQEDDEVIYNLFAYPAQCNFGGRRFPLTWPRQVKDRLDTPNSKTLVLLDAASYVMTSSDLNLSDLEASPDFVVVSFYKMFGFPTGLGAVIVKTELADKLRKDRYFGGGTVSAIASDESWQVYRTELHGRFEDGTLNFLDIVALDLAFDSIRDIFGGYDKIGPHVSALHGLLYRSMKDLKHYNQKPVCEIYVDNEDDIETPGQYGPILNFNLKRSNGQWIGYGDVERLASMKNIHVRTGGFCNPGSMQRWLDLSADEVKKNLEVSTEYFDFLPHVVLALLLVKSLYSSTFISSSDF
jgi:molybdenum cofactor sulfurtransferase